MLVSRTISTLMSPTKLTRMFYQSLYNASNCEAMVEFLNVELRLKGVNPLLYVKIPVP
ncbi:MAG: hypothetical protein ACI93R_001577 [Flavobacteriales bacterium]|jgi:hypothetical protein